MADEKKCPQCGKPIEGNGIDELYDLQRRVMGQEHNLRQEREYRRQADHDRARLQQALADAKDDYAQLEADAGGEICRLEKELMR